MPVRSISTPSSLPFPPSPRRVNNCVGWRNYPFFVRFLGYMAAGCVFVVCFTLRPFYLLVFVNPGAVLLSLAPTSPAVDALRAASPAFEATRHSAFAAEARLTLCFAICAAVGIAVSGLFGWHVYLVSSNQTSIEYLTNSAAASRSKHRGGLYRNPYDLGWRRNWETVFGPGPAYRWLLPRLQLPPGDGKIFPHF